MAVDDITVNELSGGRGTHMGSVMVLLDRALLKSYRLCIVTIPLSVTVWPQSAMQILTENYNLPKSPLPLSNTTLFGTIPSNGLSRVNECDR